MCKSTKYAPHQEARIGGVAAVENPLTRRPVAAFFGRDMRQRRYLPALRRMLPPSGDLLIDQCGKSPDTPTRRDALPTPGRDVVEKPSSGPRSRRCGRTGRREEETPEGVRPERPRISEWPRRAPEPTAKRAVARMETTVSGHRVKMPVTLFLPHEVAEYIVARATREGEEHGRRHRRHSQGRVRRSDTSFLGRVQADLVPARRLLYFQVRVVGGLRTLAVERLRRSGLDDLAISDIIPASAFFH